MHRRPPAPPPDLPGFTHVELLGSGGFADVYLYEQQLPRRRVAVKVLLADRLADASAEQFTAEANVMAMLSTHPAIVTIYQAGVAGDGRPYLVMEYCSRPNLQVRYRREPFAVAEALRVGIQVAAAVETAHRSGVLHRDIKPANILVTEYNRPALTDFGIASTSAIQAEASGISIPWSPPESVAEVPQSGPRSDVYQLSATLYTLLAGRSPFELPGERNTSAELIERIERMPLPPLGRADAPASLQRVLERAMAKNPADRYPTAVALARALQKVQIELAHSVTPIDILDEGVDDPVEDDDGDLTRVRGVVSIAPAAEDETRPSASASQTMHDEDATVLRPRTVAPDDDATVRRPATVAAQGADAPAFTAQARPPLPPSPANPSPGEPAQRRRGPGRWIAIASVAVLVAALAVVIGFGLPALLGAPDPEHSPPPTDAQPVDPLGDIIPEPEELTGDASGGEVTFTWTNPEPQEGDRFVWGIDRAGEEIALEPIEEASVTVPAEAGKTCIEVSLLRSDGRTSQPATQCVPAD